MEWQRKGYNSGYVDRNGDWQPEDVSYVHFSVWSLCTLKVKVKPGQALRVPGG